MLAIFEFIGEIIRTAYYTLDGVSIPVGEQSVSFAVLLIWFPFVMWVAGRLFRGMMASRGGDKE